MMEVDTGASLSLISEATYHNLWQSNHSQLQRTEKVLSTYTGESLEVLGSLSVLVEYGEQKSQLELLVIAGSGPSLLGRDWLLAIRLDCSQLHDMTVPSVLHKVLQNTPLSSRMSLERSRVQLPKSMWTLKLDHVSANHALSPMRCREKWSRS